MRVAREGDHFPRPSPAQFQHGKAVPSFCREMNFSGSYMMHSFGKQLTWFAAHCCLMDEYTCIAMIVSHIPIVCKQPIVLD